MTADTVGGVWTYALELAGALAPHGVEVTLATMGRPLTTAQEAEVRRLPNVRVYASGFKLEWMEDPWADVAEAGEWLLWLAESVRPDLVHLNSYAHGALPWRVPALVVGHSCVLSWWEGVRGGAAPPEWDRYRQEVTRGLRAASMVAAPTHAMRAALERHYGPLPTARVIPNGRDPSRPWRSFLAGPGAKEPFVLSAGRLWDQAKNLNNLDCIASHLEWPVYVAGEQQHPDGGRIESDAVRPLGSLSPPAFAGWLARAAIYALPARYEPFGLSVLEAALAGCALVLGDIPSLRENWDGAAVFVSPDSPAELEVAIAALIREPRRRSSLAARARDRALQFTPERMAAGYLNVYRELIVAESAVSGPLPRARARAGAGARADRDTDPPSFDLDGARAPARARARDSRS
jgi:glycogen(starch) synthase